MERAAEIRTVFPSTASFTFWIRGPRDLAWATITSIASCADLRF
jgi:hypothetical protein